MLSPFVYAMGWALAHALWQGAAVAVIARLLLCVCIEPRSRYAIYVGGVCAMLGLWLLTFASYYLPASAGQMSSVGSSFAPVVASAGVMPEVLAWFVGAWGVGASAMTARLGVGLHRLAQLRKRSLPLPVRWQHTLERLGLALGVRRLVEFVESPTIDTPMTIGWLRPAILVPVGFVTQLSATAVEAALIHELAHIRRHDFGINLVLSVGQSLLFFHPAMWWLSARARSEREYCCDEIACAYTSDPLGYALALTELEMQRSQLPVALGLLATGGSLMDRIQRLTHPQNPRRNWFAPLCSLATAVTVMIAVAPACMDEEELPELAQAEEVGEEPQEPALIEPALEQPSPDLEAEEVADEPEVAEEPADLEIAWLPPDIQALAPEIQAAAARHDVDPQLVAIVTLLESGGNATARSPSGARGLMQLMPSTAAKLARKRGFEDHRVEQLDDPAYNLDMGAYLLARLNNQFGKGELTPKTVELVAAAYNGGSGRLREALAGKRELSPETRRYKRRVRKLWTERTATQAPSTK